MAKVDVSKIDGFETMNDEEKVKALLGYEFEAPVSNDAEMTRLKNSLNKACSEAKAYKDELRAKQTEQERAEAERAEREQQREAEIAELRAYKREADYSDKLIAIGIDPVSAKAIAKSLPDGVDAAYFDAMKQSIETQRKNILDENLKNQPSLSVGTPPTAADAKKKEDAELRSWFGL